MKRKFFARVLFAVIAMSVMLTACSAGGTTSSDSPAASNSASRAAGGKKYAIVLKNNGNRYNEKVAKGFQNAVAKLGITAIVKLPDRPTAEAQIAIVEELITQQVNGIAIAGMMLMHCSLS